MKTAKVSTHSHLVQLPLYVAPEKRTELKVLSARTRVPEQVFLREAVDMMLAKYRTEVKT